ncbi:asparaginyl-tRNA synthetase [Photobacterium angustum S14]|uniref:Asparaginyl-tRNA synthetase n=3 Tax=Photobacterium angustum TaxID=661 RepID=Q1ZQH8_PHOAS|nr:asparaginyl-tRNA synthetase [Photobacterium angustum S14]
MDFNLDGVKIDKMFIDVIGVDDVKVEVLNSIIMMAKRLGIDIVAEGLKPNSKLISCVHIKLIIFRVLLLKTCAV